MLLCFYNLTTFDQNRESSAVNLYRHALMDLCRSLLTRHDYTLQNEQAVDAVQESWQHWIRAEAKCRMIYFAWCRLVFERFEITAR